MVRRPRQGPRPLTELERQVLKRMAFGVSMAEIAQALERSESSVYDTRIRAQRALGARTYTHAVVLALTTGQIPPQPCGTAGAIEWHRRRGERPCRECRTTVARGEWR